MREEEMTYQGRHHSSDESDFTSRSMMKVDQNRLFFYRAGQEVFSLVPAVDKEIHTTRCRRKHVILLSDGTHLCGRVRACATLVPRNIHDLNKDDMVGDMGTAGTM